MLEAKDYSRKGVVEDCSFNIGKGEILGFGGMVGSGRTELMRLIFGLDKKDSGRLIFNGKEITPASPEQAIRRNIGFLTEDKKETHIGTDKAFKGKCQYCKIE